MLVSIQWQPSSGFAQTVRHRLKTGVQINFYRRNVQQLMKIQMLSSWTKDRSTYASSISHKSDTHWASVFNTLQSYSETHLFIVIIAEDDFELYNMIQSSDDHNNLQTPF